MKGSAIAELFREPLSREERVILKGKEYEGKTRKATKSQRMLLNSLSDEQRRLFDEYEESMISLTEMEADENFNQGFGLGIRVAAEAFLGEHKTDR